MTVHNAEIYANDSNLIFYKNSIFLCEQNRSLLSYEELSELLFLNETRNVLHHKTKIAVYISEKWLRVDYLANGTSSYFRDDSMFTFEECDETKCTNLDHHKKISKYIYIGLNRVIGDINLSPGSGLKSVNVSFLNCFIDSKPDADIDVKNMNSEINDKSNILWESVLKYSEYSTLHPECSGQGKN